MKRTLLILAIASGIGHVQGQDSDPFFAGLIPMQLDPSRTGFDPGGRFTLLHQDQWLQLPGAWRAQAFNAEWSMRNTKKQVGSWFSIGLNAGRDRQSAVGSSISSAGLVPAMHLRAGHRSYLSAGMELRWVNGIFDDSSGEWGSQYDGGRYDASIASGEVWNTSNSSWAEARIGLSWTLKKDTESARRRERDLLVVGLSADHIGRVILQESGAPPPLIPMRSTAYVLAEMPHEIWDDGFFAGEFIAHVQGPFQTARVNVFAGKQILNSTRQAGGPMLLGFKAGLGYRLKDALLVNATIDLGRASIGMVYGWSFGNPNTMAAGRRTFEMMLQVRTGT